MQAPNDCPLPVPGQVQVWCRGGFAGGKWIAVNHTGRVLSSSADLVGLLSKVRTDPKILARLQ